MNQSALNTNLVTKLFPFTYPTVVENFHTALDLMEILL